MSNELLFICSALTSILFVLYASKRGYEWLLGTIILNLVLIGIFGAKLMTIFGLTTNIGNVFYACVFLATHRIVEQYGKRAGMKTIAYGVCFMLCFTLMSQIATHTHGLPLGDAVNGAIHTLFSFSLRVILGSLLAYVFAQYVNVSLYAWIRSVTGGKYLWLRSNGANIIAQFVDSVLFFSIAFFDLPGPLLVQTIIAGWIIKSVIVLIGTPFLYSINSFDKNVV